MNYLSCPHATLSRPCFARRAVALFSLVLSAFFTLPAFAQSAATGSISGSVINEETQKVLERATISIEGSSQSTLSAPDGSFRLAGVPAGTHTLRATYTDLETATASVDVAAGSTATVQLALKSEEIMHLGEFRVAAEREGNAYAAHQQKNAESQRTIVSADAFGVISDANPGEFLKLMPGLQMDYTGVEPRTVSIRGLEANSNLIMINGNQAAAASSSSTNRAFEFDQITIDNIESMEVFKAPVPWLPANSTGGIVNMITRSAFLQKGRRINATVNLTANSDNLSLGRSSGPNEKAERKVHPGGSFTYSDTLLGGQLGVVVSVSQVNVSGFGGTAYNTYSTTAAGTYVSQYSREDHQNYTSRTGASVNFDYKVNPTTTAFLRTTFTDHYYEFRNRFLRLNTGTIVGTATPQRVETTGGNSQQNMSFGDKNSASWTVNPGVKHRWDNWTVDYDLSLSRATNHYDYLPRMFGGVTLQNSGVGYILEKDPSRSTALRITQTAGADIYNLNNHLPTANSINVGTRNSVDRVTAGKVNVRRDFEARFPFYLQGGLSYQLQERSRRNPSRTWSYAGPDGVVGTADDNTVAGANMGQFAEREYSPNLWFGERAPNAWISPFGLADFHGIYPQAFVENVSNSYVQAFRSNQRVSEEIYGYYALGNVKFGKLDVLAGLRMEETYVEGHGARQTGTINAQTPLADAIARLSRTHASTSYTPDPFKYLHLTYRFDEKLQARASYTEAITRPNFGSIIPGLTIGTNTVSASNTTLDPSRAENLDVSIEWYPSGSSTVKAAAFSKDIKDYLVNNSYTISAPIPELDIGSDLIGYTLTTTENLGRAKIEGFELEGRYRFRTLPEWFRNIEVFANYTKLTTTEGNFNAASAQTTYNTLPNITPEIWNYGVSYETPRGKLYVAFRANHTDDILLNLTTNEFKDARTVYEAEVRYRINQRYTLSLAGRNVSEAEEGQHFFDGRATRTGTGGGAALTLTLAARF
jgi:iron complex outermembrane receptor protein